MPLKLNLFKVEKENAMDLVVDLEDSGYEMEANHEDEHGCVMLYLKKNHSENQGNEHFNMFCTCWLRNFFPF